MASLKKKKRFEKLLEKKFSSLDNIECLHRQLQDSGSDKKVIEAFNVGVTAMKTASKGDLDLDRVHSTLAEVDEMVEMLQDVQDAIANATPSQQLETANLEEELEELLLNSKEGENNKLLAFTEDDREMLMKLVDLPSPPRDISPIAATKTLHKGYSSPESASM